jgi:hypothetical protein
MTQSGVRDEKGWGAVRIFINFILQTGSAVFVKKHDRKQDF